MTANTPNPNPLAGTIGYLREAAERLEAAAKRLEARDGFHHEHAMSLIDLAVQGAERSKRQCSRALAARHEALAVAADAAARSAR